MELGYVNNNNGNSSRYLSVVRKVFEYLVHDYRVVKWNARGEVKRRRIVSVLGWKKKGGWILKEEGRDM